MPSRCRAWYSDRCQVLWYLPQKTLISRVLCKSQMLLFCPSGFSIQVSVPPNSYSLDHWSPSDCTTQYLSPSSLPGVEAGAGEGSDCTVKRVRLPRAFPTGAPSSGEQLTAALIITRLTPPLHNFNTSFYAGIWGCVCL